MVCNVAAAVYLPVDAMLRRLVSPGIRRVHSETPATLCNLWRSADAGHDGERVSGSPCSKHFSRAVHAKIERDALFVHRC